MNTIKHLILSFLILSSISLQPTKAPPKSTSTYSTASLRVPRPSKSTAGPTFCDTEFPTETIYRCQFSWNGRAKEFRIYRPVWDYHFSGTTIDIAVRDDGFYFSDTYPTSRMDKKLDW